MPEEYVIHARVYSPGEKPFKGTVLVEHGLITEVSRKLLRPRGYERIQSNAVFPGFCNAHVHAHMHSFAGKGIGKGYPEYFQELFRLEKRVTREQLYWDTLSFCKKMLLEGITRACNMSLHSRPIARAYSDSGMRARLAIAVKNRRTFLENERLFRIASKYERVTPDYGIANERETSKSLIEKVVLAAGKRNAGLQVHVAEAPVPSWLEGWTSVQYLDSLRVFSRNTIAVHCTYVTEKDVRILRDRRSWVVTCPVANVNVGSRIPPVRSFLGRGVGLGLGTDEPVINTSTDLKQEARFLHNSLKIPLHKVFDVMCAPGVIPRTGRVKEGWHADLVLSRAKSLKQILLGDRGVEHVMVGGEFLF